VRSRNKRRLAILSIGVLLAALALSYWFSGEGEAPDSPTSPDASAASQAPTRAIEASDREDVPDRSASPALASGDRSAALASSALPAQPQLSPAAKPELSGPASPPTAPTAAPSLAAAEPLARAGLPIIVCDTTLKLCGFVAQDLGAKIDQVMGLAAFWRLTQEARTLTF